MSSHRSRRQNKRARSTRRFTVRGVRRDQVDMGKLSKALIGLATAEAERQAQAEHTRVTEAAKREAAVTAETPAPPDGGARD